MSNPFALFELTPQFQLDFAELSQRYLALQKAFHPDNFSTHSPAEQRLAVQKCAEINDAFQILKDPILRAEAIVHLHTAENRDIEQKSNSDMAFLMQQMEWREQLEQLEASQNEAELTTFRDDIEQEQQNILRQLEATLNEKQWEKALAITDKLRFIKKLLNEVERVEEKLFEM
ncbi:co-chaperone HscB [Pasteurellaceae bacterium Macca]|nr:co-chaperone HscB [Pasteurellaceae bacterium Macca]